MKFRKAWYILYVCLMAEVLLHMGFSIYMHTPLFHSQNIIYRYYPMIKEIRDKYAKTDTKSYKVLVLSSSTLHKDWGDFESNLQEKLHPRDTVRGKTGKANVAIFNAAGVGYSTLDNLNCYRLFTDLKFDLVIDYIGINDARFNNCPREVYKDNYGHLKWNNETNCIMRHREMNYVITPFLIDYCWQLLYEACCKNRFIPVEYYSRPKWWQYGTELKSLYAYQKNLESTSQLSASKKEKVLFVSYCYYIPADYTLEKFKKREFDYTYSRNSREVEIWGTPRSVSAFLDSSNIISRQVAINTNNEYLDIRPSFRDHKFYADVCHFSPIGLSVFSGLVAEELDNIRH